VPSIEKKVMFLSKYSLDRNNNISSLFHIQYTSDFLIADRVSYETSFDSKQPKLEPKLVSTLSETRRLFRLFRLNIETGSFGVSIEPKQKENNRNKQEKVLNLL
jgi:hypothetical protein